MSAPWIRDPLCAVWLLTAAVEHLEANPKRLKKAESLLVFVRPDLSRALREQTLTPEACCVEIHQHLDSLKGCPEPVPTSIVDLLDYLKSFLAGEILLSELKLPVSVAQHDLPEDLKELSRLFSTILEGNSARVKPITYGFSRVLEWYVSTKFLGRTWVARVSEMFAAAQNIGGQGSEPTAPTEKKANPEILKIFLEEVEEELQNLVSDALFPLPTQWEAAHSQIIRLRETFHTLKGSSHIVGAKALGEVAGLFEHYFLEAIDQQFVPTAIAPEDFGEFCQNFEKQAKRFVESGTIGGELLEQARTVLASAESQAKKSSVSQSAVEADPELVAVFLEEATDILTRAATLFVQLLQSPKDKAVLTALHRELHTLKGGGRMVGYEGLADLAHDLEHIYGELRDDQILLTKPLQSVLQSAHDLLDQYVDAVVHGASPPEVDSIRRCVKQSLAQGDAEPTESPMPAETESEPDRPGHSQDIVRVPASELETLYALASQASISRAQLMQNILDIDQVSFSMGNQMKRLREQIRKLSVLIERQAFAKQAAGLESRYQDFDPLEMDRYNQIHQIFHSIDDVLDALFSQNDQEIELADGMEEVLTVQAQRHADLQERLLSAQLLPFSRAVPRLERLVRQTSNELHRPVNLKVIGAHEQLDRKMLNHLNPLLEHLIRNAIDHGIEDPDVRKRSGKPEKGQITLTIERHGSELGITFSDDGQGMDPNLIRARAVQKGMISEAARLPDSELFKLVLASGFSTRAEVTQLSGRGVGMDVVNSHIKMMGGTLQLASKRGQGTTVAMTTPFTHSLNSALLFRLANEQYALPLPSIEAIIRVPGCEIGKYLRGKNRKQFAYGRQSYDLAYLGSVFDPDCEAPLSRWRHSTCPVLLLKAPGARIGVAVDALEGSRQVLFRSLSKQLRPLKLLAGTTILGDGQVIVILDSQGVVERLSQGLVRARLAQKSTEHMAVDGGGGPVSAQDRILVVDDSMTVRRVTARLLERNGYAVETANNGLEAMASISERPPNLVLLDIEMPGMDGFEVARQVKGNPSLEKIPIIMVTSRTGEKHRARAESLRVEGYTGKPYQEAELLDAIMRMLAKSKAEGRHDDEL